MLLVEEEEVVAEAPSTGFLVNIFWAAAARVEIGCPAAATATLGLRLEDPVRGVREAAMAGSEVLGGRRLVKAAATAPCGSGRPPSAAAGVTVATPPTGGTRGAGVGTKSVTTAGVGTAESSEVLTGTWPVVFMPDDIWACSGVTRIELG